LKLNDLRADNETLLSTASTISDYSLFSAQV